METRFAIVEGGVVTNCVMHDPDSQWSPPAGAELIRSDSAGIGDRWDGTVFSRVETPLTKEQINAPILARITALDIFIPRGVEDLIAAMNVDIATLPAIQRERLAEKAALRTQLIR